MDTPPPLPLGIHMWEWEIGIDIYALLILCIKQITNEKILYIPGTYGKEIQRRGDICICTADSLCWTTEADMTF